MLRATTLSLLVAALAAGCSEDPQYLQADTALEVGVMDGVNSATGTITLPIRLETADELAERTARATVLGVEVPYVTIDDLSVSIEYTVKNLGDEPGRAIVGVNPANEMYLFDPIAFVIDPEEDAEPPPLVGGIPRTLQAAESYSGVLREDHVREGALDLELITRGGMNPIAAELTVNEDTTEFLSTTGSMVPEEAFAGLVQFNVVFSANTHMVLEYAIRVRDHRGLLHEQLLTAPADELTVFAPMPFAPPAPPPP